MLKNIFITLVLSALISFGLFACVDDDNDDSADSEQAGDDDSSGLDDDTALADDDDIPPDNEEGYLEPFDPSEKGPYQVGNRTYVFVDESRPDYASRGSRTLLTEVWYPAEDSSENLPRDMVKNFMGRWFPLIEQILGLILPDEELENFYLEMGSARDAPIHRGGSPYPLIMISHGNAAARFAYFSMAEYLASHGYIVVAPDHIGNAVFVTLPDRLSIYNPILMPFSAIDRVQDLWFLIDTFTELNDYDPENYFTDMVDLERIGIAGHSYGGVTGGEEAILDHRVKAMVSMACPMVPIYPGNYNTAVMFMIGTEDRTMREWAPWIRLEYSIFPEPKHLMEIRDAGHYTFSDACNLIPTLMGNGDGCGVNTREDTGEEFSFIAKDTGDAIINSYLTAFFGTYLKEQASMSAYLTTNHFPENISLLNNP